MSNEIIQQNNSDIIQNLVLQGDLSKMNEAQKVQYYNSFCQSLGLNPLTQPFQLISFQGKQRMYATKDCTEQLRKIHGVSITDISTMQLSGVFVVTAKAKDFSGKTDASTGAVNIEGLKGDALANALMKAETKAKRRVTLSICGLGILDESEIETMKGVVVADIDINDVPTKEERDMLFKLLNKSSLSEERKAKAAEAITTCQDYKTYEKIQYQLELSQQSIDTIVNPSKSDINKHLKESIVPA